MKKMTLLFIVLTTGAFIAMATCPGGAGGGSGEATCSSSKDGVTCNTDIAGESCTTDGSCSCVTTDFPAGC